MKYLILLVALTACAQPILPIEEDRAEQQEYMKSVEEHRQYNPAVYAEWEFLEDCEEYHMEECY